MMKNLAKIFLPCLGVLLGVQSMAASELATKKALTLEIAKQIAAASERSAQQNKFNMIICILDDGGNLIYLERMDDSQLGSLDVAMAKAKSALYFMRPTKAFEDAVLKNIYPAVMKVPNAMPVEGGIPLLVDGKVVGSIGVSGGTPAQDGQTAQAGVDAFPSIIQAK
jgi:glc operon protein GlcG